MPLRSSLARSAKKLLGVFRREDLDLRGQVDSTRYVPPRNEYTITPPGGSAVTYNARTTTFSTMTAGEYTMTVMPYSDPFSVPVILVGGGGDGWDGEGGRAGGAGGRTNATATFKQGNTYKLIVGSAGPEPSPATRFGGPGQNQAPAGGFTGIFYNSVTFANSGLIAGGGGGSGRGPQNPPSGGGGGGGGTSGGGNGGNQSNAGSPTGPNGGQLQGAGGFGGGGGGGYYGGGRGSDLGPYASQGGGGSGYVGGHPELPVSSTSMTNGQPGPSGAQTPGVPSLLITPTSKSGTGGGRGQPTATGIYNQPPGNRAPYGYEGGMIIGSSPPGMEAA